MVELARGSYVTNRATPSDKTQFFQGTILLLAPVQVKMFHDCCTLVVVDVDGPNQSLKGPITEDLAI